MSWVLIVDDEADIRETIAEALHDEGFDVATAADGEQALEAATHERFAAILLDLMMPRMDGWEFRERQRREPAIAAIPVIVCSAAPDRIDADAVLEKPFELSVLLAVLRAVIGAQGGGGPPARA